MGDRVVHRVDFGYMIWCQGCGCGHGIWTVRANSNGARWSFAGTEDKPTFHPSLVVTTNGPGPDHVDGYPTEVCHSFIRDGMIQYLDDCTHHLRGQTVPLQPF